ncbi:hypothetical protein BofuT4_P150010.1 [Botrytis cinerea T4]|uniref:Uncharacterized protein n=1 Tax=Botryotinia fuckeliana (strain T4) TaxID=999810 RepID=G2YW71_BOTF4|nr:hypothetical protein BofuT4_P150010.1 [Botrytis cinerea T4]
MADMSQSQKEVKSIKKRIWASRCLVSNFESLVVFDSSRFSSDLTISTNPEMNGYDC